MMLCKFTFYQLFAKQLVIVACTLIIKSRVKVEDFFIKLRIINSIQALFHRESKVSYYTDNQILGEGIYQKFNFVVHLLFNNEIACSVPKKYWRFNLR